MSERDTFWPDFYSLDFAATCHEFFSVMREGNPRIRKAEKQVHIFDYRSVEKALVRWDLFSSADEQARELFWRDASVMVQDDPPDHTGHRRIFDEFFFTFNEELVLKAVSDFLGGVTSLSRMKVLDVRSDVSDPVALLAVQQIVGFDEAYSTAVREWIRDLSNAAGSEFFDDSRSAQEYQKKRIEEVHARGSKLFRDIIRFGPALKEFSALTFFNRVDVPIGLQVAYLKILSYGAFNTLSKFITNTTYCFAKFPSQRPQCWKNPKSVEAFVEEVLRFQGPTRAVFRRVKVLGRFEDLELIPGDEAIIWLASANRDSSIFTDANQFMRDRNPNRHLSFASGVHHCGGKQYARRVLRHYVSHLVRSYCTGEFRLVRTLMDNSDPWVDSFQTLEVAR